MSEFSREGQAPDWTKPHSEVQPKNLEEFKDEIKTKWGIDFDSIPEGVADDQMSGPSLMAFDNWKIIGFDPEEDEEGNVIYQRLARVDVSK